MSGHNYEHGSMKDDNGRSIRENMSHKNCHYDKLLIKASDGENHLLDHSQSLVLQGRYWFVFFLKLASTVDCLISKGHSALWGF